MSLQERTLVVKNFDPDRTTGSLLKELCIQGGPVRNIVIKPDHAFVEYEDIESVGYSKALLEGVELFGRKLVLEPKTRNPKYFKYTEILQEYVRFDKHKRKAELQQQQMMAYYQQQQALQPPHQPINFPPVNPSPHLQMPSDFTNGFDPQICDYNTYAQNQFTNMNQMPSTSMPRNNNYNDRHSSGSNHSYSHNHRNNNRDRWSKRR